MTRRRVQNVQRKKIVIYINEQCVRKIAFWITGKGKGRGRSSSRSISSRYNLQDVKKNIYDIEVQCQ